MKSVQLTIRYDAIPEQELTGDDLRLVERAKAATQTSFSPYSHFRVGAAILLENGEIVLYDIIGETSSVRGVIQDVDLIRNTIMIRAEEAQTQETG